MSGERARLLAQLASGDLDACVRVLEALVADPGLLAGLPAEVRRRLLTAAGRVSRPSREQARALRRAFRSRDRREERAHDEALLDAAALRAGGRAWPAGVLPASADADGAARLLAAAAAGGGDHGEATAGGGEAAPRLRRPRACYVCKRPYRDVHHFYHSMCPACAERNYAKRAQTAPMGGRVALVTGGRVKIGFQAALMLLRAGARVIVTTRFPVDAASRYAREPDFDAWRDRLTVHGLDLRHSPSVELLARHVAASCDRLDVLVNNAAQTVRRPPAFYAHLLDAEERGPGALPERARPLLAERQALARSLAPGGEAAGGAAALVAFRGGGAAVGLLAPARLTQLPCTPDDELRGAEVFPTGLLDPDRQQVDLRRVNSWRLAAADVSTPELLEVHLVNAVAPFILASRLRPLMARGGARDRHVVNVSAMEASFSRRKKTEKHPHTNMAKAALNMLTRTSAADYVRDGIHMNSVDTGWVTDEDPVQHVCRKQRVHDFYPPLDAVDGAARVLDPLFTGLLTGVHPWGKFFKDYVAVEW